MHIADPKLGIFGANGIVAAGLPIAVGAAAAAQLRADGGVAVAFFGDGAPAQGAFHEALNLAAVWQLPVVFFCENNGYAEFSPAATQHARLARTAGRGLRRPATSRSTATTSSRRPPSWRTRSAAAPWRRTRWSSRPRTYRWHGHYEGDPQRYRSPEEVREWEARDPLVLHERRLRDAGVGDDEIKALESAGGRRARRRGRGGPAAGEPGRGHAHRLRRPGPAGAAGTAAAARGRAGVPHHGRDPCRARGRARQRRPRVRRRHRRRRGRQRLRADARASRDRFGPRVRDTPISETAIIGLGVGAAMAGMRPVVELMYLDFLGVCFDQLLNQAAKLPFMTGGAAEMALTVRTQFGAGRSSGSQHTQSLEALLAHIPGLTVVMPSTPADTYGLLRAAIQDPNPVVFIENRLLYGMKGPQPPADHLVPIGVSAVVRAGTDVTVVSVSRMVHEAIAAAELVAGEGISVEVIDLRTVAPLDVAPVLDSVHRTGRLLIAHEAVVPFGIGAELAATVAREALLGSRRADRTGRRRRHSPALRAGPRTGVAARPRGHRRRDPSTRRRVALISNRGRGR